MNWWWPRVVAPLILTGLGGVLGYLIGRSTAWVPWWVMLGALLGFGVTVVWDTWRGQRVLRWLRDRPTEPAPLAKGLWGEAADRIQKAIRSRERALADEQLKLSQFLSAIDASPNGVTLIDEVDGIVWCNAMASDHFAIDPSRDLAQRLTNLVRAPAFFDALQRGEISEPVEFDDTRSRRRLQVVVRRYGTGMRLVLSHDITEAERTEAMRRNFVANVSHEIRTPLTVLAGSLESLDELPLSDAERRRVIVLMRQQADRMGSLVDDLLTLARLEGSPRPPPDDWQRLDDLWMRAQADAAALSNGRHRLVFDLDGEIELAGSQVEFASLVGNLIGNAVRYTPEQGQVNVSWRAAPQGGAELIVSDTGIGIATEHLPHVTERFYRVDGSRSRETGGTGLGLAIVKHVAQRHGAELRIESALGKGSSFHVRFPGARTRRVDGGAGERTPAHPALESRAA